MKLRRITDATVEPITRDEFKIHHRLVVSTSTVAQPEDSLIDSYIKAARNIAELKTNRGFLAQSWRLTLDDFPADTDIITLPIGFLSTATSAVAISYSDEASATQTLAATAYTIDRESLNPTLYPSGTNTWPDVSTARDAVTINFIVGASTSSEVSDSIKSWIKLRVSAMYENREPISVFDRTGSITELPRTFVDGLLDGDSIPGTI